MAHPAFCVDIFNYLGLTRHSFERILFLAPIVWGGFIYGYYGALSISLVSIIIMLPHTLLISITPLDDIFEISAVAIMGNIVALAFASLRKEREKNAQLEIVQTELQVSAKKYRDLFENAFDAIWVHDLDGVITTSNKACENISGYAEKELIGMNVKSFLSPKSLSLAQSIGQKLLAGVNIEQPYEQQLIKKDKSTVYIQLVTNLVLADDKPIAFQNIARDVTEQKRLQENVLLYRKMAIQSQEKEKKRISKEIHDDTIQDLIAHIRELDQCVTSNELSEELRTSLECMRQKAIHILEDLSQLGQELRPPILDHIGLITALENLAIDLKERSGVSTNINVIGTPNRLPEEVETEFYRIAEEVLNNISQHSSASEANITLDLSSYRVKLIINDNGRGYNLPVTINELVRDGKLGLAKIQERVLLANGTPKFYSHPGKGTSITVELPIEPTTMN